MLNGKVVIDSHMHLDLHIGEEFTLQSLPKYSLRTMRLELWPSGGGFHNEQTQVQFLANYD